MELQTQKILNTKNEKEKTVWNKTKLPKDLIIAETNISVLVKIGDLTIWISKMFLFSSEFTNYLTFSLSEKFLNSTESVFKGVNQNNQDIQVSALDLFKYLNSLSINKK